MNRYRLKRLLSALRGPARLEIHYGYSETPPYHRRAPLQPPSAQRPPTQLAVESPSRPPMIAHLTMHSELLLSPASPNPCVAPSFSAPSPSHAVKASTIQW